MDINHFNIRVYAIIFDVSDKYILLSDEVINDVQMTKFPGGGMNFGEGTIDCLKREAIEEFGQEIEVLQHFYTTDIFQKALFFEDQQLISIYYKARFLIQPKFETPEIKFVFLKNNDNGQTFRWFPLVKLHADLFAFPIDKIVSTMLNKLIL